MDSKLLERAVREDLTGVLSPIIQSSYKLEPEDTHQLREIGLDINKKLGYTLFDDLYAMSIIRDFSIVSRAMQKHAIDPETHVDNTLYERMLSQLQEGERAQDELYEEIVLPVLWTNEHDSIAKAYTRYIKHLNHFDIRAFKKCITYLIDVVKNESPDKFAYYADLFKAIPEYVTIRQNFNEKAQAINTLDGTAEEKKQLFEVLDKSRTKAHNGVINLFNELNRLSVKLNISQPYPTSQPFDKDNLSDRAIVASVLLKQAPLLDTVNQVMTRSKRVPSPQEKMATMQLNDLIKYNEEFTKTRLI